MLLKFSNELQTQDTSPGIVEYDPTTGAFIGYLTNSLSLPRDGSIAFGPDGNLYCIDNGSGIAVLDAETGAQIDRFGGRPGEILRDSGSLVFGPDGAIYGLDDNGGVLAFDPSTGALVNGFAALFWRDGSIAFGPGGSLYGLDGQGAIVEYDPHSGAFLGNLNPQIRFERSGSILVDEPSMNRLLILAGAALSIATLKTRRTSDVPSRSRSFGLG